MQLRDQQDPVTPDGCRWCGVARREHVQLWDETRGWHGWEQPTLEQLRARMKHRRRHTLAYSSRAASSAN